MLTPRLSVAAAALVVVISVRATRAETDAPRTLLYHRFVPSSLVQWGFIDTTFAMTSTGGFVRYDIDRAAFATGAASRSELRLIALAHTFSGAVALARWLSVNGRVTSSVEIPRTVESSLAVGAHTNLGVEGGVTLALLRVPGMQVSARGDIGWADDRDIQPMFLPDSLVVIGDIVTVQPSAIVAFGISQAIGLQASLTYTWRHFDIRDSDDVQTASGAVAATFSLTPIPLTLLGGGQLQQQWGRDNASLSSNALLGNGTSQTRLEAGAFYTGRRDLDLGAVVTYQFSTNDDRRYLGNIRFGYYF